MTLGCFACGRNSTPAGACHFVGVERYGSVLADERSLIGSAGAKRRHNSFVANIMTINYLCLQEFTP
jgi:hypothetical protein